MPPPPASVLAGLARLFLRLGVTAFGGPAAHIALMHHEVVARRHWLSNDEFMDLVGATNLIPGPNSTELAIHIGYRRAGWRGLLLAGICFIVPAMLIVLVLAMLYTRYGTTPAAHAVLYGIKPVLIAIIAQALWQLRRAVVKNALTCAATAGVVAGSFLGGNELVLLAAAGVAVMVAANRQRMRHGLAAAAVPLLPAAGPAAAVSFTTSHLFLTCVKIGAVMYGSGYVLLAFLRADFVVRLGWLSDQQLLDAVAVGQMTPGPLFTAATFIGYLLDGVPGGLAATLGIFLPSFVLVAVSTPFIPRMRRSPWFGAFLDGVNAASLGLMATVTCQLGASALVDALTLVLACAALAALVRYKVNATWLIAGGAVLGGLRWLVAVL